MFDSPTRESVLRRVHTSTQEPPRTIERPRRRIYLKKNTDHQLNIVQTEASKRGFDGLPINQLERRSRRLSSTARSSPPQPQPLCVRERGLERGLEIKFAMECTQMEAQLVSQDVQHRRISEREYRQFEAHKQFRKGTKNLLYDLRTQVATLREKVEQLEAVGVTQVATLREKVKQLEEVEVTLDRARGENAAIRSLPLAALEELEDAAYATLGRLRRARLEAVHDARECVVCKEGMKNVVCLPCGHLCMCVRCEALPQMSGKPCPICRAPVDSRSVVHT